MKKTIKNQKEQSTLVQKSKSSASASASKSQKLTSEQEAPKPIPTSEEMPTKAQVKRALRILTRAGGFLITREINSPDDILL